MVAIRPPEWGEGYTWEHIALCPLTWPNNTHNWNAFRQLVIRLSAGPWTCSFIVDWSEFKRLVWCLWLAFWVSFSLSPLSQYNVIWSLLVSFIVKHRNYDNKLSTCFETIYSLSFWDSSHVMSSSTLLLDYKAYNLKTMSATLQFLLDKIYSVITNSSHFTSPHFILYEILALLYSIILTTHNVYILEC